MVTFLLLLMLQCNSENHVSAALTCRVLQVLQI